jgi:hypothetical protein
MRHYNLDEIATPGKIADKTIQTPPDQKKQRRFPRREGHILTGPNRFWLITLALALGSGLLLWWAFSPEKTKSPSNPALPVANLGIVYVSSHIQLSDTTPQTDAEGLIITEVKPDSPAFHAGLHPGDLLTHLHQRPVQADDSLLNLLATHRPGDTLELEIIRKGATFHFTLTLN